LNIENIRIYKRRGRREGKWVDEDKEKDGFIFVERACILFPF
jgi:hypothetical protein